MPGMMGVPPPPAPATYPPPSHQLIQRFASRVSVVRMMMGLEIVVETTVLLVLVATTGLSLRMKHQRNTQSLLPMPSRVEKVVVLVVETPCKVVLLVDQVAAPAAVNLLDVVVRRLLTPEKVD